MTQMRSDLLRLILRATLLSGTLDILSAFTFGGMSGLSPGQILKYVASGPFGDELRQGGAGSAALGLLVHFALMAMMVSIFVLAATSQKAIGRHWVAAGTVYGIFIYLVMYWMVVPTRFGTQPATSLWSVGNALFSHIICVGLPMAWLTSQVLAEQPTAMHQITPSGEINAEP